MNMKYFWIVLNSTLIALAFREGYTSMTSDRLRHTNPDLVSCLLILLTLPLFAVWVVAFSIRRRKSDQLSRPSWGRNPLNLWGDPCNHSLFAHA